MTAEHDFYCILVVPFLLSMVTKMVAAWSAALVAFIG